MRPVSPVTLLSTHCAGTTRDVARRQPATAHGASSVLSSFAGVWDGAMFADGADRGVPFSLLQNVVATRPRASSGDAAVVVGHVAFAGRDDAVAAPLRLLEASATTYVALVGPYFDAAADAQVVTVLEARRVGDRMWGSFRTRRVADAAEGVTEGRFVAVKTLRAAA